MLELLVRQFVEQNKSETLVALTDFQQLVGDKESLADLQRDEDVNADDFDVNIWVVELFQQFWDTLGFICFRAVEFALQLAWEKSPGVWVDDPVFEAWRNELTLSVLRDGALTRKE
jgi:hypothetical protein